MPRYRLRSVRTLDPAVLTELRRDQIALLQSKVTLSRAFMTLTLVQSVAGKLDELRQKIASDADPVLARLENDEVAAPLGCARCSTAEAIRLPAARRESSRGPRRERPRAYRTKERPRRPFDLPHMCGRVASVTSGGLRPGPGLDASALR
jgi:hypothetical protein